MKSRILLIISFLFSAVVQAQDVQFGLRGGIISSSIEGDASGSLNQLLDKTNGILQTTDRTGFFAGVNANIPLSENFSVEPGLYYTQRGYNLKGAYSIKGVEFLGMNARAALISHYVDVPVLLKGNFGGFQVFAGPQLSYLVQADLKTTAGVMGVNLLNKRLDASNQFNEWDAAITGGIGYQFSNGVQIMAAYDYGLMKIDANQNVNAFNRGIKIGLGIQL